MAEIGDSLDAKLNEVMLVCNTILKTYEIFGNEITFIRFTDAIYYAKEALLDGEAKWDQLATQHRDLIWKLKDAVYDADDLFDEFLTFVVTKNLNKLRKGGKLFPKISSGFEDIHLRLPNFDATYRGLRLNANDELEHVRIKRDKINSIVNANDIIGREKEMDAIINRLLDPNGDKRVQFFTIVGDGGMGKTTLAQFVCDNKIIKQKFTEPIWVSVSDFDKEWFDREAIKSMFIDRLKKEKCFIVLDDVSNELSMWLIDLKENLRLNQGGSKVLITTRSMYIADILAMDRDRGSDTYMLQRLTKEDSWRLFDMLAFTPNSIEETHHELVEIGKNIAERCSGIPVVIEVIGNFLKGQPISEWQSFEGRELAKFCKGDNRLSAMLMHNYYNLKPSTWSCFRYCAIFPKDARIRKEKIISLWMAQGYVVEHNAEYHFSELLHRFFEDVVCDEYGDIESFKVNDLMYHVAQEAGQEEICIMSSIVNCMGNNIRHVHHVGNEFVEKPLDSKKIRSYVNGGGLLIDKEIDNWMRLRVLDLSRCNVKKLPDSLGKLIHLRYLDLSHNKNLEVLCDSITHLRHLQTLDTEKCDALAYMPSGIDKLTNIRILPLFVVGNSISSKNRSREGILKDLEALCKIRGKIYVKIGTNYRTTEEVAKKRRYLKRMKYLREMRIEFKDGTTCGYNPEVVLDELEPPRKIKGIILQNYKGTRIGRWGMAYCNWIVLFPNLVHIVISKCGNLEQMPVLSKLSFLKTLSLFCLESLEYMENAIRNISYGKVAEFFPSLETLKIMWMERLKGWWKRDGVVNDRRLRLRFPRLLYLKIYKCPNMMSFCHCQSPENITLDFPKLQSLNIANCPNLALNLICPTIETLKLRDISERLIITRGNSPDDAKWRHLEVDKVRHLKSVNTNSLISLCIHGDLYVESLSEVEDAFQSCASSLRELEIRYCTNLRELSGLEHLTTLEKLKLLGNNQLSISEDEEKPWKNFHQTLVHLKFDAISKMKSLPKGMQHFTSLQILELIWCENLEELPQWISFLASLKSMSIIHCSRLRSLPEAMKYLTSLNNLSIQHGCPDLNRRCKEPDGEDFHKIQHIPNISIGDLV